MTLVPDRSPAWERDLDYAQRIAAECGVSLPTALRYVAEKSKYDRLLTRVKDAQDVQDLCNVVRELVEALRPSDRLR